MNNCIQVSVVMSCKGYDSLFSQSLRSITNQTFKEYEILIIVEKDYEIFEKIINNEFYDYINKIKLIKINLPGFGFCLNYAINISNGEYIARMDSDDLCSSDRLKLQRDFLVNNKDYSVLGTKGTAIDIKGNIINNIKLKYYETNDDIRRVLPYRNPLFHSSLMIRKSVFIKHGGYKYDFFAQDHEMFIRWSFDKSIKFYNLPDVLYYYRRHSTQETNIVNSLRAFRDISSYLIKFFMITKNPKFLVGILVVHPITRSILTFYRNFF
jgi:glycosyltransferase involved in cell wall biosynthesis